MLGHKEDSLRLSPNHRSLLIAVALAAAIGIVVVTIRNAHRAAEESARRALFSEVLRNLDEYAFVNGKYPRTMEDLKITNFPEGSSLHMLSVMHYVSDGKSCELRCASLFRTNLLVARRELKDAGMSQPPAGDDGKPTPRSAGQAGEADLRK